MYRPNELEEDLEEEVDHSFFDSDVEGGKLEAGKLEAGEPIRQGQNERISLAETEGTREGNGRMEMEEEKREKEEGVLKEDGAMGRLESDFSRLQLPSRRLERDGGRSDEESRRTEGVKEVEERKDRSEWRSETEKGEDAQKGQKEAESGREDSDASSRRSSLLSDSDSRSSSQLGDSSSLRSYSSEDLDSDYEEREEDDDDDDAFLVDDDGGRQSEGENKVNEKERHPEPQTSIRHFGSSRNPSTGSTKKSSSKFQNRSRPSPSKAESSDSGGEGRATPVTHVTSSPRRRTRQGSANRRERSKAVAAAAESDTDTVTDVTPLSTPDVSPGQSFDLAMPTDVPAPVLGQEKEVVREDDVDAGRRKSADTDEEEAPAPLSACRQLDSALVMSSPLSTTGTSCSGRRRKNYTFTNDEVRRIERENQRLMRALSRPGTALAHHDRPSFRPHHNALNRQRQQERINRENLAFLKRLESVKPTPGMTRSEQLADYQKQAGYLGIPATLIQPLSGKGSRPCSSTSPHRTSPKNVKPRTASPRSAWS